MFRKTCIHKEKDSDKHIEVKEMSQWHLLVRSTDHGDSVPSSDLQGHQIHMWDTDIWTNKLSHTENKIKKFLKKDILKGHA